MSGFKDYVIEREGVWPMIEGQTVVQGMTRLLDLMADYIDEQLGSVISKVETERASDMSELVSQGNAVWAALERHAAKKAKP